MLRLAACAFLLASAAALSIPRCDEVQCQPLAEADCPAGIGESVLSCCPFCLLAQGEECGVVALGSPKCGNGLKCYKKVSDPPLSSISPETHVVTGSFDHFINSHGVCVPEGIPDSLLKKIAHLP